MAFLKGIRGTIRAVQQMIADTNAAAEQAEAARPLDILNPTPQEAVDHLLAGDGPARGVVVRATHPPQHGERASRMKVTVRVRARLAEGALGPEVELEISTSWKVAALLDRGLEIPAVVDRATGMVTAIPTDALIAELEPRFAESAERRPGWTFDPFG
jgi:hypothetical protein